MKMTRIAMTGLSIAIGGVAYLKTSPSFSSVPISNLKLIAETSAPTEVAFKLVMARTNGLIEGNFPAAVINGNFPNAVTSGNFPDAVTSGNFPTSGIPTISGGSPEGRDELVSNTNSVQSILGGNFPNSVLNANFPDTLLNGNFPNSVLNANFPETALSGISGESANLSAVSLRELERNIPQPEISL